MWVMMTSDHGKATSAASGQEWKALFCRDFRLRMDTAKNLNVLRKENLLVLDFLKTR